MNIGELAERSGLTRSRIRFYEARGLLSMVGRSDNGYRSYKPDAVLVLKIITSAQQAGFSLTEIAKVLPVDLASWQHDDLIGLLQQKTTHINDMIAQLEWGRRNIEVLIEMIKNKPQDMSCGDNAKDILTLVGQQNDLLGAPDDRRASGA